MLVLEFEKVNGSYSTLTSKLTSKESEEELLQTQEQLKTLLKSQLRFAGVYSQNINPLLEKLLKQDETSESEPACTCKDSLETLIRIHEVWTWRISKARNRYERAELLLEAVIIDLNDLIPEEVQPTQGKCKAYSGEGGCEEHSETDKQGDPSKDVAQQLISQSLESNFHLHKASEHFVHCQEELRSCILLFKRELKSFFVELISTNAPSTQPTPTRNCKQT